MDMREVLITLKAIEFMSYGIDITQFKEVDDFKGYVNSSTKQYITRLSPNVSDFIWKLDGDAQTFLSLYNTHVLRHEKTFSNISNDDDRPVNIVVSKKMLLDTMQVLYSQGVCEYRDIDKTILDPEFLAKIQKIADEFNPAQVPTGKVVEQLSKDVTEKNFNIITALAYKDAPAVRDLMLDYYKDKSRERFAFESLKGFPVIDDRIYISLSEADWYYLQQYYKEHNWSWETNNESMKYIVISKNLYDYYFCSYGSEFQSCYSLTSDHAGWYGMLPFGIFDEHCMIYGTKEEAIKVGVTGDNCKWVAPYMYFRCWGWKGTDGQLLMDKGYTNRSCFFAAVRDVVLSRYMDVNRSSKTTVKNATNFKKFFKEHNLRFYPDSIRVNEWSFVFANGSREFKGDKRWKMDGYHTLHSVLQSIKAVKDSFDPRKQLAIVDGVLINPKECPTTKLWIDETETHSFYAKFCNNPATNGIAVITFIDGCFKLDALSQGISSITGKILIQNNTDQSWFDKSGNHLVVRKEFSMKGMNPISLKSFKEHLKAFVGDTGLDLILLRVVESDKVTFIKYKPQGSRV